MLLSEYGVTVVETVIGIEPALNVLPREILLGIKVRFITYCPQDGPPTFNDKSGFDAGGTSANDSFIESSQCIDNATKNKINKIKSCTRFICS